MTDLAVTAIGLTKRNGERVPVDALHVEVPTGQVVALRRPERRRQDGAARATGLPFGLVNPIIGLTAVVLAATRGVWPGPGTLVQPLVVGLTV